ncbi:MAG: hypothetical protein JEZ00_15835 [Anaerolineaceae bacterium]|nr:hypothetical protein [Anaerolineaceae bacterium]
MTRIRIAYIETKGKLEFLGGDIRQISFIFALGILTVFVRALIVKNVEIQKETFEVLLSYLIVLIVGFVVIFSYYFFFKSSAILHRSINVNKWKELIIEKPMIEVSNWGPDRTSLVHIHIRNKSLYKFTNCRVLVNNVYKEDNPDFIYPHNGAYLEWQLTNEDNIEISPQELINISILNFDDQNERLNFITIPANSYNLLYGRYIIELRFKAYYWWEPFEELIVAKLVCPEYDKKYPMRDFRFEIIN